jgi:hypothetical protein
VLLLYGNLNLQPKLAPRESTGAIHRYGGRRRVLPYIEPATAPAPDYAPPDIEHIGATPPQLPPQLPLKRSKKRRNMEHVLFLH